MFCGSVCAARAHSGAPRVAVAPFVPVRPRVSRGVLGEPGPHADLGERCLASLAPVRTDDPGALQTWPPAGAKLWGCLTNLGLVCECVRRCLESPRRVCECVRRCLESPRRGWILANMTHTGTGRIKHFPMESVRAPTSLSRGHIAPADTALTKLLRLVVWRERMRLVLPRKAPCSVDLRAWGYSACYSRGALDLSSSLGLPPARQSCFTRRFRYLRRLRLICREAALHPC